MKLAFLTIGVLHEPLGHPRVQGFLDRIPAVFAAAEASSGFVDRASGALTGEEHRWGDPITPRCIELSPNSMQVPASLSIWDDLESVAAYAYRGAHGEAMSKRKEWFADRDIPSYVAWWVEDDHRITWPEACDRLDHLHEHGPTATAFNFTAPFDPSGQPTRINPTLVRERSAKNQ